MNAARPRYAFWCHPVRVISHNLALPLALIAALGTTSAVPRAALAQVVAQTASPSPAWQRTARGDSLRVLAVSVVLRGESRPAERGELQVPEWRSGAASGARIVLRWLRFPTSDTGSTAAQKRPPIVFLAGGPGDAGTRAVSGMPLALLDSLRAIGDVIAFDQRATGTSTPLLWCPPAVAVPATDALDREPREARATEAVARCLTHLDSSGVQRAGYSTRESVEDLESLRVALQVPAISLFGGSYGTHLALAYLGAYPTRVERALLAGVEGLDDTFKLPSRIDAVFTDIARAAALDAQFAGRPSLLAVFDSLRAQLDATRPLATVGAVTVRVNGFDLQRLVADALGDHRSIAQLPSQLYAIAGGNLEALARTSVRLRQPRPINAMNLLVNCASGASPARWEQIDAERASSRLGDAMDFPAVVQCRSESLSARATLQASVSRAAVLFVSGTWDGRTPPSNVEPLLSQFPNARHLVIEYASHNLMGDPAVMDATGRFFRGEMPRERLVRRPQPPFVR
jgi:pimeloyl-ACP methyl ester carboxylesterase